MIRVATRYVPSVSLRPLTMMQNWMALSHQRKSLSELDDAMLSDIGLTPDQAQAEASRPFWDAPNHWLK